MQNFRYRLLWCLAVILAALLGVQSARKYSSERQDRNVLPKWPIAILSSSLEMGSVWYQDEIAHAVTVENTTDSDLNITYVHGTCSCQSVQPANFRLLPHESRSVIVAIKTQAGRAQVIDSEGVEKFAGGLCFNIAGEPDEMCWAMKGSLKHSIACAREIDLGYFSNKDTHNLARTFPLRRFTVLESLEVRCKSDLAARVSVVSRDQDYELQVELRAGLATGAYHFDLALVPKGDGGKLLPEIPVTFRFEVGPDVVAIPRALDVGARTVGERVTETISVQSVTGRNFTVRDVTCSGGEARVTDVGQQGIVAFEVSFRIAARNDTLVAINTTDDAGVDHTIRIPLKCQVIPRPN